MNRSLLVLSAALLVVLTGLWSGQRTLDRRFEERRRRDSEFVTLLGDASPKLDAVARLDLTLPGSATSWTYARQDGVWRLPQYHDGFALGREVEGILQAFLDGRGTIAGSLPQDEGHFGLTRDRALGVELHDAAGALLLQARAGAVAPGPHGAECYLTGGGRAAVLQVLANPWPLLEKGPGGSLPPLADTHVIPAALQRGSFLRVSIAGAAGPAIREVFRRAFPRPPAPPGQRLPGPPDRSPRYEWWGLREGEGGRHLNDTAAAAYLDSIVALTYVELVGPGQEDAFDVPRLRLTIQYDGGAKDVLVLGAKAENDQSRLLNTTTGEVFLISDAAARALVPDPQALLK